MSPTDPPLRYMEYPDEYGDALQAFEERVERFRLEQEQDVAFALKHDAVVMEGPWDDDDVPAQKVAYIGIDEAGQREVLAAIHSSWRFSPVRDTVVANGSSYKVKVTSDGPSAVIAIRVPLGRRMPGMVVGRPFGQAPVQAYGIIDGADYYFRSRGKHWSMRIGGSPGAPDWYYEEPYGTWPEAGSISNDQAYDFIANAVSKFRAGVPSTAERTIDRGSASILTAIGALPPDAKVE